VVTAVNDEKYRRALQRVAENCGAHARTLLVSDRVRFPDAKVRALAGTAPEYQRHVIGRAVAGDANPFRPTAATLLVYDTVAFREVTSRLHRALGMIRLEVAVLERALERERKPDRFADRLLTLGLVTEQADRLRGLLAEVDTVDGPSGKKSTPRESDSEPTDKLNAAGALGLIAKNVRNVALLQPAHRPTQEQKGEALRLSVEALNLAMNALQVGSLVFGWAYDDCRFGPTRNATRRVITHDKVDGDAVAAAWLAERFLFAGERAEVLFVPRGRVWGAWRAGDCIVGVGNTHDPRHLFFDHKPPAFESRHDHCAAWLVWCHLVKLGRPVRHLKPLVDVVHAGHSAQERAWFRDEYAESRRAGFHKALADARAAHRTDADVYRAMRRWLDDSHKKAVRRTGSTGRTGPHPV
jgi:hypothetical protein